LDEEDCELFAWEDAYLIGADDLESLVNEWRSYAEKLASAMDDMIAITIKGGAKNADI
jgi:hypothetical protein